MRGVVALLLLGMTAAGALPTVAAMRHQRRVLIVTAPSADDRQLAEQRRMLDSWQAGARDRDISVVSVVGSEVSGATDTSAQLRAHWKLRADRFAVLLVGKDGHEALRSAEPLSADKLEATIDAMPMRHAGLR